MGSPTYDQYIFPKTAKPRDLDWLDQFIRDRKLAVGADLKRQTVGATEKWQPPGLGQRILRMLDGRARAADATLAAIMATPAIVIARGDVVLTIIHSAKPYIVAEAQELANDDGLPIRGATWRYEMHGKDPDLVLEDIHANICNALHETGEFVLYSDQAGVWDPARV